jgi:hypothetical protein
MSKIAITEFARKHGTNGIKPQAIEAAILLGAQIAIDPKKKFHGGLLILGDTERVMAKTLPLQRRESLANYQYKKITDKFVRQAIVRESIQDGAIIINGNGAFIASARYVTINPRKRYFRYGFGGCKRTVAMHITGETDAIAILISHDSIIHIVKNGVIIGIVYPNGNNYDTHMVDELQVNEVHWDNFPSDNVPIRPDSGKRPTDPYRRRPQPPKHRSNLQQRKLQDRYGSGDVDVILRVHASDNVSWIKYNRISTNEFERYETQVNYNIFTTRSEFNPMSIITKLMDRVQYQSKVFRSKNQQQPTQPAMVYVPQVESTKKISR